jgi:drug/metabolite transporter (DMT)-like permease
MCWAVANTLTVFAVRNVGLSIAFPLWNINSLVGLFWGWLLFNELRGAGAKDLARVIGGTTAIVAGACVLAYATSHQQEAASHNATLGILAALGAGLLWGTMYVPYRKAYISGMNPLSFVTVFTFGELGTRLAMALAFDGGYHKVAAELVKAEPVMFWLFLGGFAARRPVPAIRREIIGISRGIPLSNTNQIWGLLWGALVFGELAGESLTARLLVIGGSLVMIAGALAISQAEAPASEQDSWRLASERECDRYGMDADRAAAILHGDDPLARETPPRHWLESVVTLAAIGIFVWLGLHAKVPNIAMNIPVLLVLLAATIGFLIVCGRMLGSDAL